jgi:hypothetical protein
LLRKTYYNPEQPKQEKNKMPSGKIELAKKRANPKLLTDISRSDEEEKKYPAGEKNNALFVRALQTPPSTILVTTSLKRQRQYENRDLKLAALKETPHATLYPNDIDVITAQLNEVTLCIDMITNFIAVTQRNKCRKYGWSMLFPLMLFSEILSCIMWNVKGAEVEHDLSNLNTIVNSTNSTCLEQNPNTDCGDFNITAICHGLYQNFCTDSENQHSWGWSMLALFIGLVSYCGITFAYSRCRQDVRDWVESDFEFAVRHGWMPGEKPELLQPVADKYYIDTWPHRSPHEVLADFNELQSRLQALLPAASTQLNTNKSRHSGWLLPPFLRAKPTSMEIRLLEDSDVKEDKTGLESIKLDVIGARH